MKEILIEDLNIVANSKLDYFKFKGATFLITGATGLIGSLLVKALLTVSRLHQLNIRVVALVRNITKAKAIFSDIQDNENISYIVADLADDEIVFCDKIDYIVHAAAVTTSKIMVEKPVETIFTAIRGTEKVLNLALTKNVRTIVYISSMEIYGSVGTSGKVKEDSLGIIDLTAARSCYPEGKRMCECLCNAYYHEYGLNVLSARLAQTFGAGILPNENRVFAQFARSAINGEDIVLHTEGKSEGNYVYTRDAILAIFTLLLNGQGGQAYNVTNESSHTTIAKMAQLVADEFSDGKSNLVFDIPDNMNKFGYAPDVKLFLSSEKLRKLGWQPKVALTEAYARMIEFMK